MDPATRPVRESEEGSISPDRPETPMAEEDTSDQRLAALLAIEMRKTHRLASKVALLQGELDQLSAARAPATEAGLSVREWELRRLLESETRRRQLLQAELDSVTQRCFSLQVTNSVIRKDLVCWARKDQLLREELASSARWGADLRRESEDPRRPGAAAERWAGLLREIADLRRQAAENSATVAAARQVQQERDRLCHEMVTVRRALEGKEAELADARRRLEAREAELEDVRRLSGLQEAERLQSALEALRREGDALRAGRSALRNSEDRLLRAQCGLRRDREALLRERDELLRERDELRRRLLGARHCEGPAETGDLPVVSPQASASPVASPQASASPVASPQASASPVASPRLASPVASPRPAPLVVSPRPASLVAGPPVAAPPVDGPRPTPREGPLISRTPPAKKRRIGRRQPMVVLLSCAHCGQNFARPGMFARHLEIRPECEGLGARCKRCDSVFAELGVWQRHWWRGECCQANAPRGESPELAGSSGSEGPGAPRPAAGPIDLLPGDATDDESGPDRCD